MTITSRITAKINIASLQHNLNLVKTLAPQTKVMAMVKANAYGLGVADAVRALDGADAFAVANIAEAVELRNLGVGKEIVVLGGPLLSPDYQAAKQHDLSLVIHHPELLRRLNQQFPEWRSRLWVKLDTGMHRLGLAASQFQDLLPDLKNYSYNVMTHLACADDVTHPANLQQQKIFSELTQHLDVEKSVANSAAIIHFPDQHYDWVRPGIMLYGGHPQIDRQTKLNIRPVVELSAAVLATRDIAKNEFVGYGARWHAPKDMKMAVVGIGYADGYPRSMQDGAPVFLNDSVCPMIGRVSMDMICVDISHCEDVEIGDKAELFGSNININDVAKAAGTIPYELLTRLNHNRIDFIWE